MKNNGTATSEQLRLEEDAAGQKRWKLWGPYLSERQWDTVREDYSPHGNAWEYVPHDHARSRAYRWGEDGLAGISDDQQRICLSLALWNGKDPPEFEVLDTGIFDDDRYFDVFVEYAKADAEDILMLVTVHNRGPETATIHLLPQLWFRNTWAWKNGAAKPELTAKADGSITAKHSDLGEYVFHVDSPLISTGLQPGVGSQGSV